MGRDILSHPDLPLKINGCGGVMGLVLAAETTRQTRSFIDEAKESVFVQDEWLKHVE